MADKLVVERFNSQLNEPTNQDSIRKVTKVVNQRKGKNIIYNFWDLCNKELNVPSLPV